VLRGQYNPGVLTDLLLGAGVFGGLAAAVGLAGFSRRDV
jgi:hypothetical protein